jgi:hypothetical protein
MPSSLAVRKVFKIAEMREAILRQATPETRLVLHNVSDPWRDIASYVIGADAKIAKYFDAYPCAPVEYPDPIGTCISWQQSSQTELQDFELGIAAARRRLRELPNVDTQLTSTYFPARLTQAHALSQRFPNSSSTSPQSSIITFCKAMSTICESKEEPEEVSQQLSPHLEHQGRHTVSPLHIHPTGSTLRNPGSILT